MHKRYFLKLVRKHIRGKATPEEEQLLLSYYNLFELEPDVVALLNNEEKEEIKNQISESIKQKIANAGQSKNIRSLKIRYISAAAAILIGIVATYTFFTYNPSVKPQIANVEFIKKNENHLI